MLVTLLDDYGHSGCALKSHEADHATLASKQSDNIAAEAPFGELETIYGGLVPAGGAVQQTLRISGDRSTAISTGPNDQGFPTWGRSVWTTSGEVLLTQRSPTGVS